MPHVDVDDSQTEREGHRRRRDDVTDEQSDSVLELSRFAFKTTHSSMRTPDPGSSRPTTGPVRNDPPDHLPDPYLAQLSKCISCGLEWTSKKTAKQKRTHIKQCAKKHALTQDTIRFLVQKEIVVLVPTQSTYETTLMDSVVPRGPPKKSKPQQIFPTVIALPEARDSILSKARDILGPASTTHTDPQPTQQFGQSALARRNTQLKVNKSMGEPPSTQPFGSSSLRGGITTTGQLVDSSVPQFGGLLDSMSSDRYKRPASPFPSADNSRTVRRRLLQ